MILTQIICMLLGSVLVIGGITIQLLGLFTYGVIPFAIIVLGVLVLLGGLFE